MSDATGIEQRQSRLQARVAQMDRELAVRSLLRVLDPQPDHDTQDYPEILRRAQNALAAEFHQVRGTTKGDSDAIRPHDSGSH